MDVALAGRIEFALSHFTALGVAAIATQYGHRARFFWSDDLQPVCTVRSDVDMARLADLVRQHSRAHITEGGWLSATIHGGERKGSGSLTVRAKPVPAEHWSDFHAERRSVRALGAVTPLDEHLLSALGEPAWWLLDAKGRSLDDGGSRWEMKTRNRGEEFLLNRFLPLGRAVAARTAEKIADGLAGISCHDETGGGLESRSSTGLTTPRPTDSAVAWCALWGLHVMPTIPRRGAVSQSACVWPRNVVHPRQAILPVFTDAVSPRRFAEVCATSMMDDCIPLRHAATEAAMPLRRKAAQAWLREQGVRALVTFTISKTGSSSAPERQMLAGEVAVLDDDH